MPSELDTQLKAIAVKQRRDILYWIRDQGTPVEIDALHDEFDSTNLHHMHLPKLQHTDLLQVDETAKEVRFGDAFDDVEPVLDAMESL